MTFHHMLKDVPHHRLLAVDNLFSALHGLHDSALNELSDHERLVELGSHELWNATFVHLELPGLPR